MRLWLYILICFFLLPGAVLIAQSNQTREIASGISRYRSYLLESKPGARQQLGTLLRKLERLNIDEEERKILTTYVGLIANPEETFDPSHKAYCIEALQNRSYLDSLSDQELSVLAENADLYDLINLDVLELEYPYKVRPDFALHHELFFYDIQNNDRIGEIGAGNGEFSILLSMIYDSLRLFINEVDPYLVRYIHFKVDRLKYLMKGNIISIVKGETNTSNFIDDSLDKVILRSTYHHFTDKKHMLASIHEALDNDGILYLYEATKDRHGKKLCPHAMYEKDIIKQHTKAGFMLVDRKVVDNELLLKFRVAKNSD